MSLLLSNLSPLRTQFKTYTKIFRDLLEDSDQIHIASGYISTDSAVDLKSIIEANGGPRLELCVGMHYFDGLSVAQLDALRSLDETLRNNNLGQVYMVTTFPFHGKLVAFSKNETLLGSILGSSNLTNIVDGQRQYEADYLFNNADATAPEIKSFIKDLIDISARPLSELEIKPSLPENNLLKDQVGVLKLIDSELLATKQKLSELSFEIPLKGDGSQKSGFNTAFGKGRENSQGFVMPRPWYEVELIVPKTITTVPGYPQASPRNDEGGFDVITDDGWAFRCKTSGDFSKNLRSEDDLKILGRWLKGRLENAGVLKPGDLVTDDTLTEYGRSTLTMTKLEDSQVWYLDFGVN
ncbi:MAG TPA: restriction endonuclease PLD domain-containing protein [Verrucomicrobiae bacterium]|nr:restriction endonuclease PLD domain-containing protein [Verrucomicrobiae bacterium]